MSAFWMLGQGGKWPDIGEIDILENPGFDVNRVFATIHCKAYNWMNENSKGANTLVNHLYFYR